MTGKGSPRVIFRLEKPLYEWLKRRAHPDSAGKFLQNLIKNAFEKSKEK